MAVSILTTGTAALASACADAPTATAVAARDASSPRDAAGLARYRIEDLGTLQGGSFSEANSSTSSGRIVGVSDLPGGVQHAVLWSGGGIEDIGAVGLGGPNSFAFAMNDRGQVAGQAEAAADDAEHEDFCGYGTGRKCLPFLWQHGAMASLPLLGGNNGTVGSINARGEVVGIAETGTRDPACPTEEAVTGVGPLVLDFEAVIWGPGTGQVRELPPLPGDQVGMALWINDRGQAVGASGSCANTVPPPFAAAPHAVLWERDGTPRDLGSLGGSANPGQVMGNVAFGINNRGQVVGISTLPGNAEQHGFLWTRATGMQSLDPLPGDPAAAALAINDRGEVVGASADGPPATGNPRAVIWRDGAARDLNELVAGATPLYLLVAFGIDDAGQIVGLALDTGRFEPHAFRATPVSGRANGSVPPKPHRAGRPATLPPSVRGLLGWRPGRPAPR